MEATAVERGAEADGLARQGGLGRSLAPVLDALPHLTSAPPTNPTHGPHDRTKDRSRHRMTSADMDATQARGPVVGDMFSFAMLRSHDFMDVVTDLVKQDLAEEHCSQESDLQQQRRGTHYGSIDEHLNPSGLPLPRLVVQTGRISVP